MIGPLETIHDPAISMKRKEIEALVSYIDSPDKVVPPPAIAHEFVLNFFLAPDFELLLGRFASVGQFFKAGG